MNYVTNTFKKGRASKEAASTFSNKAVICGTHSLPYQSGIYCRSDSALRVHYVVSVKSYNEGGASTDWHQAEIYVGIGHDTRIRTLGWYPPRSGLLRALATAE